MLTPTGDRSSWLWLIQWRPTPLAKQFQFKQSLLLTPTGAEIELLSLRLLLFLLFSHSNNQSDFYENRSLYCRRKYSLSFNDKGAQIVANLKAHPTRSAIIIGLFIMYLPIVYQIHLNMVAEAVVTTAGGYFWPTGGFTLFPIPYDSHWFGVVTFPTPRLSPIDAYIYSHIYPSIIPRVMWSIMWLTFGILYIISPLLKSSKSWKKKKWRSGRDLNSRVLGTLDVCWKLE